MDQDDDEFLYGDHSTTTQPPPAISASLPGLSVGAPPPAHQEDTTPAAPAQHPQADPEELEEGEEEEEEVEVSDDEDVRSPSRCLGGSGLINKGHRARDRAQRRQSPRTAAET
jgi:hypothetical protein